MRRISKIYEYVYQVKGLGLYIVDAGMFPSDVLMQKSGTKIFIWWEDYAIGCYRIDHSVRSIIYET